MLNKGNDFIILSVLLSLIKVNNHLGKRILENLYWQIGKNDLLFAYQLYQLL